MQKSYVSAVIIFSRQCNRHRGFKHNLVPFVLSLIKSLQTRRWRNLARPTRSSSSRVMHICKAIHGARQPRLDIFHRPGERERENRKKGEIYRHFNFNSSRKKKLQICDCYLCCNDHKKIIDISEVPRYFCGN
ncbi:hypothetical protein PUN28_009277 [Cardiocondyla obscurior]|uniref:Uncharacterized protein n=1 Tax=Cardiocondyla obscurior TaxID=286306 RepID=A0AAW2FTK8_9HYME